MNKKEFLKRLSQGLDLLDEVERREIIGFYEERFHSGTVYEGKTEEEVVADLESPETIARNVLEEYGINPRYVKTREQRYQGVDTTQVIGIVLFDTFIVSWLLPAIVSITFALFATLISYVGVVPLIIGERTMADTYMFAFLTAGYVLLFFIALAFLDLSIGLVKKIIVWHLNTFKLNNRERWIKKMSRFSIERLCKTSGTVKFLRSILIIGSIITIGYTGYHLFVGGQHYFSSYANANEQTEEYNIPVENLSNWMIETNLDTMDITIIPVDRTDIHITHTYIDDQNFVLEIAEETKTISMTQDIKHIKIFNVQDITRWFTKGNELLIEVPLGMTFEELNLDILNGQIEVSDLEIESMNLSVMNGKIVVDNVTLTRDTTLTIINGNINLDHLTSNADVTAKTVNGHIVLNDVVFMEYTLTTENGKILLDNLNVDLQDGLVLYAKTTNGTIDLTNVYVADVTLKTTNGSIDYFNDDTTYILDDLDTSAVNGFFDGNVED